MKKQDELIHCKRGMSAPFRCQQDFQFTHSQCCGTTNGLYCKGKCPNLVNRLKWLFSDVSTAGHICRRGQFLSLVHDMNQVWYQWVLCFLIRQYLRECNELRMIQRSLKVQHMNWVVIVFLTLTVHMGPLCPHPSFYLLWPFKEAHQQLNILCCGLPTQLSIYMLLKTFGQEPG